jgi:hypothetical protein
MSWVPSNRIRKNKRKEQFNIQCICMVYTMYIPELCNIHGICMVYTIHIPCKIFIGVPDDEVSHDLFYHDVILISFSFIYSINHSMIHGNVSFNFSFKFCTSSFLFHAVVSSLSSSHYFTSCVKYILIGYAFGDNLRSTVGPGRGRFRLGHSKTLNSLAQVG